MNNPQSVIIHHSLTKDGLVVDWTAIRKYHMTAPEYMFRDIGYHWGIERVGDKWVIQKGRDESDTGAHCKEQGMNAKSIGICVVGNYDIDNLPQETFDLLVDKIKEINGRYKKQFPIEPHSKYATYKTCPGKKFPLQKVLEAVYKPVTPFEDALNTINQLCGINVSYWSNKTNIDPYFDDLMIKIARAVKK